MIFRRHKILLTTLAWAPRIPTRMELMKWLFLMRQEESPLVNDSTFYDFVPYKYGPFSFTVYRDIQELERLGLVIPNVLKINPTLGEQVNDLINNLSNSIQVSIRNILIRYAKLTLSELINIVYNRYPWFASMSKHKKMNGQYYSKAVKKIAVYTSGYEGQSIDGFLSRLLQYGITTIIDVRNNPVSRKYGYSKSALLQLCSKVGLKYYHYPELGIPPQHRAELNSPQDYDHLFKYYVKRILPAGMESQKKIAAKMRIEPSALVCFEQNPLFCHRNHLAQALSKETNLEVVHL